MKHLVAVLSLLLGFSAFAEQATTFGQYGFCGSSGSSGRPGYNGQDATITVTGPANYDLSGTSGEGGYDGSYGGHASYCYQPQNTTYNLMGANGGEGGNGGDGGRGGDSGNLTVYYNALQDLRSVYVRAVPGQGGYGAYGGRGGCGCRCTVRQWTVNVNGQPQTFQCYDGMEGRYGRQGDNGQRGNYGYVTLIGQTTPLLPTQPTLSIPMENILSGPFQLSQNEWETKTGTNYLFAPGSQLNDTYRYFKRRVEKNYQMRWQVNRPLSDFTGKILNLKLEGQNVLIDVPDDVWHLGHEEAEQGSLKTYTFDGALYKSEAMDMAVRNVSGSGSNLKMTVEDRAGHSDIVKTSFRITYKTKAMMLYYVRYSGAVSTNLVTQNGNTFEINVGKLPIQSKFLSSGNMVRIYLDVYRTYGSHQSVKTLEIDYTIP